jgi:hypothetical protein
MTSMVDEAVEAISTMSHSCKVLPHTWHLKQQQQI